MNTCVRLSTRHCAITASSVAALFCGCTTTIDGRPASTNSSGIRYYLPAPHIYMEPQSDGTVTLEVKYLPDPTNAYTLDVNTYFSAATFTVGTTDGILTSVALNSDSSAVAAKAVEVATDLRNQKLTAQREQVEAKKTQEASKMAAIKGAAEAVTAQRESLELLEAKLAFQEKNKPGGLSAEERLALDMEISQEKLKLKQLERRLGLVRTTSADSFNDPGGEPAGGTVKNGTNAFGPVLFRVLPDGNGVKLVALEAQRAFPAAGTATLAGGTSAAGVLDASPKEVKIQVADAQRNIVIRFTEPVQIDTARSSLRRPADGIAAAPVIAGPQLAASVDGAVVTITPPADLAKGAYRLDLVVRPTGGEAKVFGIPVSWLES